VTETQRDLAPSREDPTEERDPVSPVAASSRSGARHAEVELLKSHPLEQWDSWIAVRAADEPLLDALNGNAVTDR
jgi:hypothetical protein